MTTGQHLASDNALTAGSALIASLVVTFWDQVTTGLGVVIPWLTVASLITMIIRNIWAMRIGKP
jgi:hypothetical protein